LGGGDIAGVGVGVGVGVVGFAKLKRSLRERPGLRCG